MRLALRLSGSRSCGSSKCLESATEDGIHSLADAFTEEKVLEQESLDLVQKDLESNHDLSHGCCDEEHDHHPNLDKAYDSCALQEPCYSVQRNITDISETGIEETSHCDSTKQTCQTVISGRHHLQKQIRYIFPKITMMERYYAIPPPIGPGPPLGIFSVWQI